MRETFGKWSVVLRQGFTNLFHCRSLLIDKPPQQLQIKLPVSRHASQPILRIEPLRLLRREAAETVALGDELIAICGEYGLVQELEWGRSYQGLALADLGRTEEGVAQLQDSLEVQKRIHARLFKPVAIALLGEALLKAGRFDKGLQAVDAGFEASEAWLERHYVAQLHLLRGELLQRTGDAAGAERSYRQALDVARTQGARSFELRAATGLARLLEGTDRESEGRQQLSSVYDSFTEGHATRDLRDAAALIAAALGNGDRESVRVDRNSS